MKSFLRQLKQQVRTFRGKDLRIHQIIPSETEFHGTEYGGWAVVAGSISETSRIYSFGIGEDASFDLSLIKTYKCTVRAFDPTPKSLAWAKDNIQEPRFLMRPWALGNTDGKLKLYYPKDVKFVSASIYDTSITSKDYFEADCFTLDSIMERLGDDSLDLLKMDIEGAEYEVIERLAKSGLHAQIDQILVEFHHWIPEIGLDPTRQSIATLNRLGFQIHWVSKSRHEVLFRRPSATFEQTREMVT